MAPIQKKWLTNLIFSVLNILWWVELIGTGILLIAELGAYLRKENVSLNFPLSFSPVSFKTVQPLGQSTGSGVIQVAEGNFYLPIHNNLQTMLLLLIVSIMVCAGVLFITHQLKLVFAALRNSEPFNQANANRIRSIGIACILFSILLLLSNIIFTRFLFSNFSLGKELALTYRFNIGYLITGVGLIIAAEILKEGAILKEETNLTI